MKRNLMYSIVFMIFCVGFFVLCAYQTLEFDPVQFTADYQKYFDFYFLFFVAIFSGMASCYYLITMVEKFITKKFFSKKEKSLI